MPHNKRCTGQVRRIRFGSACVFAAFSAASAPASAQYFGGYGAPPPPPGAYGRPGPVFRGYERPLPADEVVERLEERGFDDVGRPRFNGSTYEVDATNRRGRRVRLVIDAFRGNVVGRYGLGPLADDESEDDGIGARPRRNGPSGWFGNNVRPPDSEDRFAPRPFRDDPSERSARIDPPGPIESAPLPNERLLAPGEAARPQAPARKAVPKPPESASLPKPLAPSAGDAGAPSRVEGGNPDRLNGEQRQPRPPVASKLPAAPAPISDPVATVPASPLAPRPDDRPSPAARSTADSKPGTDSLSPIKPLRPQVAPDTSAPGSAETGRPVRIIGGVTPVPASPSTNGGPLTADSESVKP